jgi:Zn-dependent protease with chaperone function
MLGKLNRLSGHRNSILSGVFSTHPPTDKRIQRIQKLILKDKEKNQTGKVSLLASMQSQ